MFDLKVGPLVAGLVKGAIKDDRYDFLGDLVGDLVDEVPDIIADVEKSSGLDGEEKFQLVLGTVTEAVDDVLDALPWWGSFEESQRDALLDGLADIVRFIFDASTSAVDWSTFFGGRWVEQVAPAIGKVGQFAADAANGRFDAGERPEPARLPRKQRPHAVVDPDALAASTKSAVVRIPQLTCTAARLKALGAS